MTWLGHKKNKSAGDNSGPTAAAPLGWRYAGPQPATYSITRSNRNSLMARPTQFHRATDERDNFKKVSISKRTLQKDAEDLDSDFNLAAASVSARTSSTPLAPLTIDTTSPLRSGATVRTTTRRRRLYTVPPYAADGSPIKRGESVPPPRSSSRTAVAPPVSQTPMPTAPPPMSPPPVTRIASSSKIPATSSKTRPHPPRSVTSAGALPTQPIPEGSEIVPLMLDTGNVLGQSSLESITEAAEQQQQEQQRRSERHLENKRRYKKMQMENHNLWVLLDAKTRQVDYIMQALHADGRYDQTLAASLENSEDVKTSIERLRAVNSQMNGDDDHPAERSDPRLTRRFSKRDTATTNLNELKFQLQQLLSHVEDSDSSPPPYGNARSPIHQYGVELEGTIPSRFYSPEEKDASDESAAQMTSEAVVNTLCPAPLRHHPGSGDAQLVEKLENHAVQEQEEAEKRASQFGDDQKIVNNERPLTMLRVQNTSPRSETSRYSKRFSQFDPTLSVRYDTPKSAIVRSYLEMAPTRTVVADALKTPTPPPTPPPKSQKRLLRASEIHPALRAPSLDSDHGSDTSETSPPATPPDTTGSPVNISFSNTDGEDEKKESKDRNDDIKTTEITRTKKRHDSEPLHWLALESPL